MADRQFVVTQGISADPDAPWFAAERMPSGALRRVKSPRLPARETRIEAERDLYRWLESRVYDDPRRGGAYREAYQRLRGELQERAARGIA
jgi:hypothetical protein